MCAAKMYPSYIKCMQIVNKYKKQMSCKECYMVHRLTFHGSCRPSLTALQMDSGPLSQRSAHAEQYAQTKTNTNPNPHPNRYRRSCPGPNARIQKFIHYMAIAAICDSGPLR